MELFLPIPEGKQQRQENGSWHAFLWSARGHVEMNNSISCLPGNRKWNYFCLFLKENSRDKKMEVDKHICVVLGAMLELIIFFYVFLQEQAKIIPFPVSQQTGNGIIHFNMSPGTSRICVSSSIFLSQLFSFRIGKNNYISCFQANRIQKYSF